VWPVWITDKIMTPLIISANVESSEFEVDFQRVACQVALQKNSILPCASVEGICNVYLLQYFFCPSSAVIAERYIVVLFRWQ